jgi:hypothetical protein
MIDQVYESTGFSGSDGLHWLETRETVEPDDPAEVGGGRVDFIVGSVLSVLNLFVSGGIVAVWYLQTVGVVVVLFLGQDPGPIESASALSFVTIGALLGLAVGVGGFATFSWKRWPAYYWPIFGIAITLGASILGARV